MSSSNLQLNHWIIALLAILILNQCDYDSPSSVEPGPVVLLSVLTPDGNPADGVSISVFEKQSGNKIELCSTLDNICDNGEPGCCGSYFIFHDTFAEMIINDLDLQVTGNLDSLQFQEEFKIGRSGDSIFKIAGPDTVFLAPVHHY